MRPTTRTTALGQRQSDSGSRTAALSAPTLRAWSSRRTRLARVHSTRVARRLRPSRGRVRLPGPGSPAIVRRPPMSRRWHPASASATRSEGVNRVIHENSQSRPPLVIPDAGSRPPLTNLVVQQMSLASIVARGCLVLAPLSWRNHSLLIMPPVPTAFVALQRQETNCAAGGNVHKMNSLWRSTQHISSNGRVVAPKHVMANCAPR